MSYDASDAQFDEFWDRISADFTEEFLSPLRDVLRTWDENRTDPDEEFWQNESRNLLCFDGIVVVESCVYVERVGDSYDRFFADYVKVKLLSQKTRISALISYTLFYRN